MPRRNHPSKTWQYSADFKIQAVELSLSEDVQVQQVAAELDIHPFMLSRWRKAYREGTLKPEGQWRAHLMKARQVPTAKPLSKLKQLERENARLRKENELLKKWQRYLAERHQSALDSSKSTDNR